MTERFLPSPRAAIATLELLRDYKSRGMTERMCWEAARSVEQWENDCYHLGRTEFEIEKRADSWVEMYRRLKV